MKKRRLILGLAGLLVLGALTSGKNQPSTRYSTNSSPTSSTRSYTSSGVPIYTKEENEAMNKRTMPAPPPTKEQREWERKQKAEAALEKKRQEALARRDLGRAIFSKRDCSKEFFTSQCEAEERMQEDYIYLKKKGLLH